MSPKTQKLVKILTLPVPSPGSPFFITVFDVRYLK